MILAGSIPWLAIRSSPVQSGIHAISVSGSGSGALVGLRYVVVRLMSFPGGALVDDAGVGVAGRPMEEFDRGVMRHASRRAPAVRIAVDEVRICWTS